MKLRHLKIWFLWFGVWVAVAHAASPIYLGSNIGLFKSVDAGATWTSVNIPLNSPLLSGSLQVWSLSMDPHDTSKLYLIGIATAWGFFASTDAGKTWTAHPFIGMVPNKVAVDFAGQVIYITASSSAGSSYTLLYKSTDMGATWTRLKIPNTATTPASQYPLGSEAFLFVPDPTVSGTVYALTNGDEFFKSVDFGSTWTEISGPGVKLSTGGVVPQTGILNVNVDPRNPLVLYDGTDHSSFPATCPETNGGLCGLFKSTDGGATFTGLSIPSNYVRGFSFGAVSGTVYATGDVSGLGTTVLKSTDAGTTWRPLKNGLVSRISGRVQADPIDANTLYVYDIQESNLYFSTDAGGHFTKSVLPQGPSGCVPGNCSPASVNDLLIAASVGFVCTNTTQPVITSIDSASAYGGYPYFASGSWLEIKGSNLADAADPRLTSATNPGQWTAADFVGVNAPTLLDGVSVSINGKPAYVWYLSTGQLNVQAPEDSTTGNVFITVTNCKATSLPFTFARQALAPGFLAPSNYTAGGTPYMVATFSSDGA